MTERPRRTGYRLADLEGGPKGLVIAVFAAFALAPLLAGARSLHDGWQPTGDVAIIAIRSLDAWTGDAPLVGQPTTGEEFTGKQSNHPGPGEYWILGAAMRVLGDRAGVVLGAALVNSAALLGIVWLSFRRGGTALLALVSVALAGLVHSLGAGSLHDAFNSELATYPMLLALLAAWCVAVGDLRVLAVLVAASSLAAQVHVAGAAFVAPLLIVALVSLISAWRKHPGTVRKDRWFLAGAGGVAVLAWLPVVAQELSGGPSNLSALWSTATTPRPRIGLSFILERVATAVAPVPTFLRPTGRFGFLVDASALGVVIAFLIIAAVASLGALLRHRGRGAQEIRLAGLVLLAGATSIVAGAGQPPLAAFRADGTRWLWVLSLAVWVTVAWEAWPLLAEARQRTAAKVLVPVGAGLAVLLLLVTLGTGQLADERDGSVMPVTDRIASQVLDELPDGTYHVRFAGNQALVTVGPGIVYRLASAGRDVRLDDSPLTRGYGDERTTKGDVDGSILIASGPGIAKPEDGTLIASGPVDPDDPGAGTVRVYLAP